MNVIPVSLCLEEKEKQIVKLYFVVSLFLLRVSIQGADPGFVRPEAYTIFGKVF